ncbi:MAG: non-hydrolyzing UDP-N-acetylglucosamine 2-epimerase [Bacteroidales bacterium]
MPELLFIFGTRPEAIKLAPLIQEFRKEGSFGVKVCVTAQHRQMLDQVLDFFNIIPDYDLNLMRPGQTLYEVTARALLEMKEVLDSAGPDMVFVQGDTNTVFAGALAAYYQHIPVAHIEAGLRSYNKFSPFPEEMNRLLTSRLSDLHFAHTAQARENLVKEGITEGIHVVGNTVIDALKLAVTLVEEDEQLYREYFKGLDPDARFILITCHRRESFGQPFRDICTAFNSIARANPDVKLIYPVHLNPNVLDVAHEMLRQPNIILLDPLEYPHFVWLMNKSYLVLTDSGGIQEEAPALGKPVLVLREVTERMEGIEAGTAKLLGTDTRLIIEETQRLLDDTDAYTEMAKAVNPYGDGTSSRQIVSQVLKYFT